MADHNFEMLQGLTADIKTGGLGTRTANCVSVPLSFLHYGVAQLPSSEDFSISELQKHLFGKKLVHTHPEFRKRPEVLLVGPSDGIFRSAFDTKFVFSGEPGVDLLDK